MANKTIVVSEHIWKWLKVVEVPIIYWDKRVSGMKSPFAVLMLSSERGGIDIPYVPGKGWKIGGRKVKEPFVKDGVFL